MTPIFNCPRPQYDAVDAMNQSTLKHAARSMAHLRYAQHRPKRKPSEPMILGLITESFVFKTPFLYTTRPEKWTNWRTKESREWRAEQEDLGATVVSQDTIETARAMAGEVALNPLAQMWMEKSKVNIALFGVHEGTNGTEALPIKCLIDVAPDEYLLIPDLKTTADASPRGFAKSVCDFGYDVQAAFYQRLWRQNFQQDRQFGFIAVESAPPYVVQTYVLRQDDVDKACQMIDIWMSRYQKCLKDDIWPGYSEGLQYVDVPKWRFSEF